MMTRVSAAVTVSVSASTVRAVAAVASWQLVGRPNTAAAQAVRGELRSSDVQVVEIAVPAELLDGHQELHGGDAQLRDQFAGASRVLSGTSTAPMRVSATAICTQRDTVGHDQPDPGALAHARLDERGGHGVVVASSSA